MKSQPSALSIEQRKELSQRSVYFFDRDGTLTLGGKALPGAIETVNKLLRAKKSVFVLTNNSSKTPKEHLAALNKAGFKLNLKNILVSIDAAAMNLKSNRFKKIWWMASPKVSRYLTQTYGFKFEVKKPEAVLLTYDVTLNYKKLVMAAKLISDNKIKYYCTHPDVLCPTPDGLIPDLGCVIDYLKAATGRSPDLIFGKPNVMMIDHTLKSLGKKLSDAVIVGDRLYTDIALADGNDLMSVLVLSGETDLKMYEGQSLKSDIVLDGLSDFAI